MGAANSLLYGDVPCRLLVPGLRAEDITAAHTGLFRFDMETPTSEQHRWSIQVPRDPEFPDDIDDGVNRKTGHGGLDQKIFLHYRPDLWELLAERHIELELWQSEWLAACGRIWQACTAALEELVREMDRTLGRFGLVDRLGNAPDNHCLRVLKYAPRTGSLASGHYDRCGITFRIAESHSGFYTRHGWEQQVQPAPQTPEVSCFTGEQLERITEGAVPRLWHGAVDTTEGVAERWAIVFFGKFRPK